jgi:hypothetical protein
MSDQENAVDRFNPFNKKILDNIMGGQRDHIAELNVIPILEAEIRTTYPYATDEDVLWMKNRIVYGAR